MIKEISDYDKFDYDYEKYWKDSNINRSYEDQAERIALKKLLPKKGGWFCDLGAGFGRLFDCYRDRFENIILADYSIENLKKAQKQIQQLSNETMKQSSIHFIALNAYNLPFKDNSLDYLMSVRMLHHIEDVPKVLEEISRTIKPEGKLILEYANKKHGFEILKALLGRSKMKPFSLEPTERGSGPFYNFHPQYISSKVQSSKLKVQKTLSVSNFRHKIFKKIFGTRLMILLEKVFQTLLSPIKFGPSIFLLAEKKASGQELQATSCKLQTILCCPKCKNNKLEFFEKNVKCQKCDSVYKIIDNIYDFRV